MATQSRLAEFPRYRVVSGGALQLAELQQTASAGRGLLQDDRRRRRRLCDLRHSASARAFRIGASAGRARAQVDALRATIAVVEDSQQLTYPFDLDLAHGLYQSLFGPVAAEVGPVTHLIFEPDGAMLRLPPNLLVMDRAAIDAYRRPPPRRRRRRRLRFPRHRSWLGRDRDISTAVSARAFRDVRQAPPSRARAEYLGFGENEPAQALLPPGRRHQRRRRVPAGLRLVARRPGTGRSPPRELVVAGAAAAPGQAGEAEIVTGAAFTDTAIMARGDLADYRILHFATHGLVTPPRPECPARPALLTSFGGEGSDGLLSFAEIFDLRLDADLVILSACDTAGRASLAATARGGPVAAAANSRSDGLVRAFVGAGGRMVVASHWPVPDDYDATERLISGLFTAPPGTGTAAALRVAQRALMDERDTSHPYYWSGFAVVGDGAAPVGPRKALRRRQAASR